MKPHRRLESLVVVGSIVCALLFALVPFLSAQVPWPAGPKSPEPKMPASPNRAGVEGEKESENWKKTP